MSATQVNSVLEKRNPTQQKIYDHAIKTLKSGETDLAKIKQDLWIQYITAVGQNKPVVDNAVDQAQFDFASQEIRTNGDSTAAEIALTVPQQKESTESEPVQPAGAQTVTFFESIALPLIKRGWAVVPLYPKQKRVHAELAPEPLTMQSNDPGKIHDWAIREPEANVGRYAIQQPGGNCFIDIDAGGLAKLRGKYKQDTGKDFPQTLFVRSSVINGIEKGHLYFNQTSKTMQARNITEDQTNGWFSYRVNNYYVASIGSIHPLTGKPYEIRENHPVVDMPDEVHDWLEAQRVKKPVTASVTGDKIPYGQHDNELHRIAGKLRYDGLEEEAIYNALVEVCEKRCDGYKNDYLAMCRKHAKNICLKPVGRGTILLLDGKPVGSSVGTVPVSQLVQPVMTAEMAKIKADQEARDAEKKIEREQSISQVQKELLARIGPYPKFPLWAIEGTSIYNGLVKPYCDVNSRYPEFLWMPAMTLLLNFIGTKVRIECKDITPSIFLLMIGKKGKIIKSSSVKDAMQYFSYMGLLDRGSARNAEGKILVFTPGSAEGLGMSVQLTNCKNFVLHYDELAVLADKAGIESSTLASNLLQLYESDTFSNLIKAKKDSYRIEGRTYCCSVIACTTDRKFKPLWAKMNGTDTGMNDRWFFLYQPETFKEVTPPVLVNTQTGAIETRKLIDRAVRQGVYRIDDQGPLAARLQGSDAWENRQEIRAEKFALGFAVDLGFDSITDECIERGLALVEYERAVKKRFRPYDAENKDAALQLKITDELSQNNGVMSLHELERKAHFDRHGSFQWGRAMEGLQNDGRIDITGSGKKGNPKIVTLLRVTALDDDE